MANTIKVQIETIVNDYNEEDVKKIANVLEDVITNTLITLDYKPTIQSFGDIIKLTYTSTIPNH